MTDRTDRFMDLGERRGYELVAIHPGTKRPVYKNWQTIFPDTADYKRWGALGYFIAIRTGQGRRGTVVAIDSDSLSKDLQKGVYGGLQEATGVPYERTTLRFGQKPKVAYLMRMEGSQPARHDKVKFLCPAAGVVKELEIRTTGQQLLADAIHPSGIPYDWPHGLSVIENLWTTNQVMLDRFVAEQRQRLPNAVQVRAADLGRKVDQAALVGDWDRVEAALKLIPNTMAAKTLRGDGVDYDMLVAVAYALKAAVGEPGEALFYEFAERWQDGTPNHNTTAEIWRYARGPFRAGASYIYDTAKLNYPGFDAWDAVSSDLVDRFFDHEAAAAARACDPVLRARKIFEGDTL